MILILTESPGTARRLDAFFASNDAGLSSKTTCMATLGYVLVPGDSLNPLGLYLEGDALQEERRARHPDVLRRILESAYRADHIILATDPDEEGEVIAQDLATIFTEAGLGEISASRLRLYGLDNASIRDALATTEPVHLATMAYDWPPALAGHTRRILDRWIAGSMGTRERPVGRVIAGFLDAAQRFPSEQYNIPSVHDGIPAHLGDLLLAPELGDCPVQRITDTLQVLYETGRVSYPRTDSHDLSPRTRYSHTALHLLGTSGQKEDIRDMARMEPPGMPLETRILTAVARREMTAQGDGYDLFPPKTAQSADQERRARNLRERAVLRVLQAHNLGRPSTWTGFATKHADWVTGIIAENGILTDDGRRTAAWQPEAPGGVQALGLPFQKDFRAFLERLSGLGGHASQHAMDALKLLDSTTVQHMMEGLDRGATSDNDWRDHVRVVGTVSKQLGW